MLQQFGENEYFQNSHLKGFPCGWNFIPQTMHFCGNFTGLLCLANLSLKRMCFTCKWGPMTSATLLRETPGNADSKKSICITSYHWGNKIFSFPNLRADFRAIICGIVQHDVTNMKPQEMLRLTDNDLGRPGEHWEEWLLDWEKRSRERWILNK